MREEKKRKEKDVRYVVWDSVTHFTRTTTLGSGSEGGQGSEQAWTLTSSGNPTSRVLPHPQLLSPDTQLTQTDPDAFSVETWLSCRRWQDMLQAEEGRSHGHSWWLPPKGRAWPAPEDPVGSL